MDNRLKAAIAQSLLMLLAGCSQSSIPADKVGTRTASPEAVVDEEWKRAAADSSGKVRVNYRIFNRGGSNLVLKKVSTSCSCSVV
jgi:hypothetical protein